MSTLAEGPSGLVDTDASVALAVPARHDAAVRAPAAAGEGETARVSARSLPRDREGRPVVVHVMTVALSLQFLRGLASYLRRTGFEVHAITAPGAVLEEFGAQERIAVHAVPMTRSITPAEDLGALWRLWRKLRRIHPDIVHAHTPKGGLLGMAAATLAGVPIRIYHLRGLPFVTATGARRRLLRNAERVSCELAHRVLAISRSMRAIAVEEGICPPEKIRVIREGGNGVDAVERFVPAGPAARIASRTALGIPPDALVIGFVGRFAREKGLVELAQAWARLRVSDARVHLLLVGPSEEPDGLPPGLVERLRADPRAHLTGLRWDTPTVYGAMDVVALPTYREGFPNVPLEAAAMALPVVATQVPGCVDAVQEGVTGTLVPPRDASGLAAALAQYLRDPELRERHGRDGRRRVLSDFRREAIWEGVAEEYQSALVSLGATRRTRATREGP